MIERNVLPLGIIRLGVDRNEVHGPIVERVPHARGGVALNVRHACVSVIA